MGASEKKRASSNGVNHRLKPAFLPIDDINILTQIRRSWSQDYVLALADNICFNRGLQAPIIVVRYSDVKLCRDYLRLTNRYYQVDHKLPELIKTKEGCYLIVLSGEMRLRAHRSVWEQGCSACRELYGQESPGKCFSRHLTSRKIIEVRLYRDIPATMAMDIQLAGNCHELPAEAETIRGHGVHYRFKKEMDPKLTIAKFARFVGRSPTTMSKYLKIFDLPREIFEFFESGLIPSGIAFELAYLKERGETDLQWWAQRAIVGRMKVEFFHRKIREFLAVKNQGVLELFEEASEAAAKRAHIKATVNQEMVNSIYGNLGYWRKVLALFERGQLGKSDSPFSAESPTRIYRLQVDLMKEAVLPHLAEFFSAEKIQEISRVLEQVDHSLAGLPVS